MAGLSSYSPKNKPLALQALELGLGGPQLILDFGERSLVAFLDGEFEQDGDVLDPTVEVGDMLDDLLVPREFARHRPGVVLIIPEVRCRRLFSQVDQLDLLAVDVEERARIGEPRLEVGDERPEFDGFHRRERSAQAESGSAPGAP